VNERQPKRCRKMRLACAGRAKEHDIGTLIEPAVASGKRHDLRLADHGHGVEVECVERFARRQPGAGQMPLDAAATAIGDLVFGEWTCPLLVESYRLKFSAGAGCCLEATGLM